MNEREVRRTFALGMAEGHLAQARGPVRAEGDPGSRVRGARTPTRVEWMLGHAQVAAGWLRFAAELT